MEEIASDAIRSIASCRTLSLMHDFAVKSMYQLKQELHNNVLICKKTYVFIEIF